MNHTSVKPRSRTTRFQLPVRDWLTITGLQHLTNRYETKSDLGEHAHKSSRRLRGKWCREFFKLDEQYDSTRSYRETDNASQNLS